MRHIHLDLLGGLAGDMFLAALLDAGVILQDDLREVFGRLGFGAIELHLEKSRRGALAGTHLSFSGWDPVHDKTHRHLTAILEIIENAELAPAVKQRACEMFTVLGEAEASVHGMSMEKVHFHECGAMDSILDFVGSAWALESLDATWSLGPIPMGHGTTTTDHGIVPVPVPATVALLQGIDVVPRDVEAEMVTPTGATIIKALHVDGLRPRPAGRCQAVGYGLGSREVQGIANAVRCLVLESSPQSPAYLEEEVCRLSCDIDDMNPELMPLVERGLFDAGALDVSRQAIWMKKGRQGTCLVVLCQHADRDRLVEAIFTGTTTFGLRVENVERMTLQREFQQVETEWGSVRIKLGFMGGRLLKTVPELEDCARLAGEFAVSIGDIYAQAADLARRQWRQQDP